MSRPEITTPESLADESVVELSLRPQRLAEFIGQGKVKEALRIYLDAALARKEPLDHALLFGPPGLGKTTLAELIARCTALNYRQIIAVIGDSANAASIGLHQKLGFRQVGVLQQVGEKFGRRLDVVVMQRGLGQPPKPS